MTNKNWLSRPLYFLITVLAFGVLTLPASAQTKVTALIAITNTTVNGMTFVLNGSTRTFTNVVYNSAAQVLTNSDVTGNGSKTNLLTQIYGNPFAQVLAVDVGSNTFALVGNANLAMSATLSAGLGTVSYSTQTVASVIGLQGPISALPTAVSRTNNASAIVGAANAVENTNKISQISTAASELMGLTNGQTISGVKVFTNALGQWFGVISNSPAISGTIIALSGGLLSGCTITQAPSISGTIGLLNGGIYTNATLTGGRATNFGITNGSYLTETGPSMFLGEFIVGNGTAHCVISNNSGLTVNQLIGVDDGAEYVYTDNIGDFYFGDQSSLYQNTMIHIYGGSLQGGPHTNGYIETVNNGVHGSTLDDGSGNMILGNNLTVSKNFTVLGNQTNNAYIGTNTYGANGDVAFVRHSISSLANGNNAAIPIGTNIFNEVSGPSGSFTINGMANGRDGKLIYVVNQTGFQMTIANESGTDPTAANRIRTLGAAADVILTNASCTFIYNGSVSRWLLISHNP